MDAQVVQVHVRRRDHRRDAVQPPHQQPQPLVSLAQENELLEVFRPIRPGLILQPKFHRQQIEPLHPPGCWLPNRREFLNPWQQLAGRASACLLARLRVGSCGLRAERRRRLPTAKPRFGARPGFGVRVVQPVRRLLPRRGSARLSRFGRWPARFGPQSKFLSQRQYHRFLCHKSVQLPHQGHTGFPRVV